MRLPRDRRLLLTSFLLLGIASAFWSGSRYPALNEKAAMGGGVVLEDPLGFEARHPLDPTDPFPTRVAVTTFNWIDTNKQGMTFGLLFAAAFMTLLSLLERTRLEGSLSNSLLGVVVGAPLGVCVNCAAPIARGLHASGARIETSLAAMISSPTLNVVVLTMLFSLFPLYLALLKVGLALFTMLVVIPLASKWFFQRERTAPASLAALQPSVPWAPAEPGSVGTWREALLWVTRRYARNLWFIAKYTVPLMLLAGLLGSLAVTAMPWEMIAEQLPGGSRLAILGTMGLIAVIGLFLPVPIAFDVVLPAAFLATGMPVAYVMVLLFTLGIFSVYSFFVIWEAISLRVAGVLAVALLALGVIGGGAAHVYEKWSGARQQWLFTELAEGAHPVRERLPPPTGEDDLAILSSLEPRALRWQVAAIDAPDGIAVERRVLREPRGSEGALFKKHLGDALGLVRVDDTPVAYKFMPPFYRNWPIAAGDVHGDGWPDVLLGSDRGLQLFANREGRGFVQQRIDVPGLEQFYVSLVALVDLDGDGLLDIFFSAYRAGQYVIYNDGGRFHGGRFQELPNTGANLANAAAFGDLDGDGDLDVVLGNWSSGRWNPQPPDASRNAILWNDRGRFRVERLPGVPGETLSTLLSDINGDGHLDLLVGNDFVSPDVFYLGGDGGKLDLVEREMGIIPHATTTTMSIDSADINNDLLLEIYIAQITGSAPGQREQMEIRSTDELCGEYTDPDWKSRCEHRMEAHAIIRRSGRFRDALQCLASEDLEARNDCTAYALLRRAAQFERKQERCDELPDRWEAFRYICHYAFEEPFPFSDAERRRAIPQILNRNVLLVPDGQGAFIDRAKELGVAVGGWSWNAKFADVDNDEWQDLYVVNGAFRSADRESNIFYRNQGGRGFAEQTREAGLENFLTTAAYVYLDMDDDGDLDIIQVALDGPVWVFENRTVPGNTGNAILFELDDKRGNRRGIGSKIIIHYGPGGARHQLREIKAGGGFLSFEPARAHFGLGEHQTVQRVEVHWSTGERSEIVGAFAAGSRYRITRR